MRDSRKSFHTRDHAIVTEKKESGAVYTPKMLADFVSRQIVNAVGEPSEACALRILDPAIGDGELLKSLLEHLPWQPSRYIEVYGFETNLNALETARKRVNSEFPNISVRFESGSFLEFALRKLDLARGGDCAHADVPLAFDLIIANPPYVRTQILGTSQARLLSEQFGLSGRVDLYHAFILGISHVLKPNGIAGIIVSNRFMTTKSGASVRRALFERFNVLHAWDLGDTKLFEAAVLPAVLLVQGRNGYNKSSSAFTSIYETSDQATKAVTNVISALQEDGVVTIDDGRNFRVRHGKIDTNNTPEGVWRLATRSDDRWLKNVAAHTWGTFREIGKVRVGVKTCADKVFVRSDWQEMKESVRPELLKALTTHRVARRFKSLRTDAPIQILYPHEVVGGRRRVVDLAQYPKSQAYLTTYRPVLESRKYIIEAGRQWYEIWVPQDPDAWEMPKLVFRDIASKPIFWIDLDGTVVNGDCYWLVAEKTNDLDLLWLAAAVANSTFVERFYDLRFNNKLYAGRRRFITQYVENFPLPDPYIPLSKSIIAKAKQIYRDALVDSNIPLQRELDTMVWEVFGGVS